MQRVEHINRMNKIVSTKAYVSFLRQLKSYITTYHSIAGVSQELGIPEEVLLECLTNKRPFAFDNFVALMGHLEIIVLR